MTLLSSKKVILLVVFGGLLVGLSATGSVAATDNHESVFSNNNDRLIETTTSGIAEEGHEADKEAPIYWANGAGATHTEADNGDSIHAERLKISFGSTIEVGPERPYTLEVINVETGDSVKVEFEEQETFSDGMFLNIYQPTGEFSRNPDARAGRNNESKLHLTGDKTTFTDVRAAPYRVVLYENGVQQAETQSKVHGIGYTLDYDVGSNNDSVKISIPRDRMPRNSTVELKLGSAEDDNLVNDPFHEVQLEYDIDNDRFTTTFDADELTREEYSWVVLFNNGNQVGLTDRILFTYGFEPLNLNDDGDDGREGDDGDGDDGREGDDGDGDDGREGDDGDGDDGEEQPADDIQMQFDPSEPSVEPGQRKTVDIVIADADQGVSAYDFAVEVADPTVATITDAEFVEFGGQLGSIDIAENGSRVSFEEAVGDRDPADPTFTIAQLTVTAGEREGTTQLTVDNAKIEDNNFNEYDLESRPATVTVIKNVAPDVTGNGEPAQDVNGDGLYEDINGDGTADIFDVQALFANQGTKAVQNNAELFDFTGDGSINIFDVQALFEQIN